MIENSMIGSVISVCASPLHTMSKPVQPGIRLIDGSGVEGDAHASPTVKHRSRVRIDPSQPNLRQVHLLHSELFEELERSGFGVKPGQMGENITTVGIDLLGLAEHTMLHIGENAVIRVTGLRNPCSQLDGLQPGLMQAVLDKDESGNLIRKAGIMGVVITGGEIKSGDQIVAESPSGPFTALEPV